jgi:hypothetical protein
MPTPDSTYLLGLKQFLRIQVTPSLQTEDTNGTCWIPEQFSRIQVNPSLHWQRPPIFLSILFFFSPFESLLPLMLILLLPLLLKGVKVMLLVALLTSTTGMNFNRHCS